MRPPHQGNDLDAAVVFLRARGRKEHAVYAAGPGATSRGKSPLLDGKSQRRMSVSVKINVIAPGAISSWLPVCCLAVNFGIVKSSAISNFSPFK